MITMGQRTRARPRPARIPRSVAGFTDKRIVAVNFQVMIPYRAKAQARNRALSMFRQRHLSMNPKRPQPFELTAFNERGELKTPRLLVLSLVFLCRYPISLALGALSTLILGRRGLELGGLGFPPLDALAVSMPSLLLLVLILLGEKAARLAWVRRVLRRGVAIAVVVCVLQVLVLARILIMEGMEQLNRVVFEGVLLGYCAVYLLRSERAAIFFRVSGVLERD
jgi:hypothetical protein